VLAQDIYFQLKDDYRVFFSRITLEDKLGQEYEPYIFSALNSAKIMLVVGTEAEHFNAVWVRNEWSRFLALAKADRSRLLIPCYRDMDPYGMPQELSVFQSQDMSKIGFLQDLIRGIEKVMLVKKAVENSAKINALNSEVAKRLAEEQKREDAKRLAEKREQEKVKRLKEAKRLAEEQKQEEEAKQLSEVAKIRKERKGVDKFSGRIVANSDATIFITPRGTVAILGWAKYGDVSAWSTIVAVTAGNASDLIYHLVGLKADGTVVSVGGSKNRYGKRYANDQCNVNGWRDIIAISAGNRHTVGLRSDGTVVSCGSNEFGQCNTNSWKGIIAISAGSSHTVGLKPDGTAIAVGNNGYGQCDLNYWSDITAISAGEWRTVTLRSDGSVVSSGFNDYGKLDIPADWKDIVAISAGHYNTVGLKSDGTVVAVGNNGRGQCNTSGWRDIVAISAGTLADAMRCRYSHTVGLKSDGTLVATGNNDRGQCNVTNATNGARW
jgi:hypothetical protein